MRRGNDSRVDLGRLRAAQPLELLVLEHAKQLDLHVDWQITNLVQENRRAVGELEAPDLAREGARVGAFLPAEQLAFDQRRRNRRAVDPDHGLAAAPAQLMNLRREHLFAGTGFAQKEHRRIGLGHLADLFLHAANRGAPADTGRIERRFDFTAHAHLVRAQPIAQALDIGECMA